MGDLIPLPEVQVGCQEPCQSNLIKFRIRITEDRLPIPIEESNQTLEIRDHLRRINCPPSNLSVCQKCQCQCGREVKQEISQMLCIARLVIDHHWSRWSLMNTGHWSGSSNSFWKHQREQQVVRGRLLRECKQRRKNARSASGGATTVQGALEEVN